MSEPGNGTTQTLSSEQISGDQPEFDQSSVDRCLKHVEDFKRGETEKADALLEIQYILHSAIAESNSLTQLNFKPGFKHFLELLDHVSDENESGDKRQPSVVEEGREDNPEPSEPESVSKEKRLRARLRRREHSEEAESDDSGDEHEYVLRGKRRKLTPERMQYYPWLQPNTY